MEHEKKELHNCPTIDERQVAYTNTLRFYHKRFKEACNYIK